MTERVRRHAGVAALVVSILAIVISTSGLANAARTALFGASTKPRPHGLLLLGSNAKFPSSAIPTVTNANRVGGASVKALTPHCPAGTPPHQRSGLPVGLTYRIRPLIGEFLVVSTGNPILVDESAEERSAVEVVLGEVDGAWWSGFGLRWTELTQGAVGPLRVVVLQVTGEGSAQVPFVEDKCPVEELAA